MLIRLLRLLGLFTSVEPPATDVGGEVAPVTPAPSVDAQLDAMVDGAADRFRTQAPAERVPDTQPPATPAGTPPPAAPNVLGGDPPESLVPDDAPYRDVKAVRDDIARAREQYGPAAQALAAIPEAARGGFIATLPAEVLAVQNPEVAGHLATIRGAWTQLHPSDQQLIAQVLADAPTNPAGAENIAYLVEQITDVEPDGSAGSTVDNFGFEPDDPNRPVTVADLERREQERQVAQQKQQAADAVLTQIRDLGYSPDSQDPVELGMVDTLLSIARRLPDGTPDKIQAAHEVMGQMRQKQIDDFVAGKADAAARPLPSTTTVAATGATEPKIETLDEMIAAGSERARQAALRAQQQA